MADYGQADAMIARLEGELEERNAFIQGVIGGAQNADRDLSDNEKELLKSARDRVENLRSQLDTLQDSREVVLHARERSAALHRDMAAGRRQIDKGNVEYRSAGAYAVDAYKAAMGDREARERLEIFTRAADHVRTTDMSGVVPDPVVGGVINFIDAARPIVSVLGPRDLPAATWHRPKVTQHTSVGKQGTAGAAADEKSELVSQKMVITRLNASAVTYGGYVNVSRQSIDLGSGVLDAVINDLAGQYSVETEAATADSLMGVGTTPIGIGVTPTAETIAAGLWEAAGVAYTATRGQGRLVLAVSPTMLGTFGPLFVPVNPQGAISAGFNASQFGQGVMGAVSGISLVMSAGLTGNESVLFSTAAVEVYEQRVGTLQVTEPSVLGTQVGYAGYFTPLVIEAGGVIPLSLAA